MYKINKYTKLNQQPLTALDYKGLPYMTQASPGGLPLSYRKTHNCGKEKERSN